MVVADAFEALELHVSSVTGADSYPADLAVQLDAYPNPFSGQVQVKFSVPSNNRCRLELYDLLGERVALIVEGEYGAGEHLFTWKTQQFIPGTYILKLTTENQQIFKRIMYVE